MKAAVSPTVSPAGTSTIEQSQPLISSTNTIAVLLRGHLLNTWQCVKFHRYFPSFTLMLDIYQNDMVVIYQMGLVLMRKIPSTR
ncbi:hypothetical protein CesoFtcFv8_025809 [Champsocephalus esox]|uniref:Uncharacterized protein n=1 Tax=Champsocephalus esox TaxID=159716 RepID=A0AAN8B129_9TELE|nr:hypothetical protein CesoFtcFv8_025809 [Champsocephalus esox]